MRRLSIFCCMAASWVALVAAASPASHVLLVPDQYPTIQAAVDAAQPGDRIVIGPGDYAGAVITQPVEVQGNGPTTRITSGAPGFPSAGFYVALNQLGPQDGGVAVSHLSFDSPPYPDAGGMFAGVVVRAADYASGMKSYNVEIHHSSFAGGFYGAYLLNCEQCSVHHNDFANNETPIMLWAAISESVDDVIAYNTISSEVQGSSTSQWVNAGIWLNAILGGTLRGTQVLHNAVVRPGGTPDDPAYAVMLSAVGTAVPRGQSRGVQRLQGKRERRRCFARLAAGPERGDPQSGP